MTHPSIKILYWLIPRILFIFINRIFVVTQNQTVLTAIHHAIVELSQDGSGSTLSQNNNSSDATSGAVQQSSGGVQSIPFSDDLGIYQDLFAFQANTTQETLSQLIQSSSLGSDLGSTDYDYQTLRDIFLKVQTPQVGQLVFLSAMNQYMIAEAYAYREQYGIAGLPDIPPALIFQMLTNSPLMGGSRNDQLRLGQMIQTLITQGIFDAEDGVVYQALVAMLDGKFQDAQQLTVSGKKPRTKQLNMAISEAITQRSEYRDVPSTYLWGLNALAALKSGRYQVAQRLAIRIVTQNPDYILPYQVLAYSHFVMNDWKQAREYYLQLFSMDPSNASVYAFFLGISSYRQKNYTDAIIYLKQAKIAEYEADTLQYLLLAYQAIGDENNTMRTFESLLMQSGLTALHFRLYFDFIFFRPYAIDQSFGLFEKNVIASSSYLETCFRVLPATEQSVCMYGQAGVALARGNIPQAGVILKDIANVYPYSYIYRAIGDRYASQSDRENAKIAYIRSLALTASDVQQGITKQKLYAIFPFLSSPNP